MGCHLGMIIVYELLLGGKNYTECFQLASVRLLYLWLKTQGTVDSAGILSFSPLWQVSVSFQNRLAVAMHQGIRGILPPQEKAIQTSVCHSVSSLSLSGCEYHSH